MWITLAILWLLFSGYLLSFCFHGMNIARDDTYIGGIIAICLWFFVVTPMMVRRVYNYEKKKTLEKLPKERDENEKEIGVNGKSAKSDVDAGLHTKNRPGNGRN